MKEYQERFSNSGFFKRKDWKHYWQWLLKNPRFSYYCIAIRENFFLQPLTSQKGKSDFCHHFSLSLLLLLPSHAWSSGGVSVCFSAIWTKRYERQMAQHPQRGRGAPQPSPLTTCGLSWRLDIVKTPLGSEISTSHRFWLKSHTHERSANPQS